MPTVVARGKADFPAKGLHEMAPGRNSTPLARGPEHLMLGGFGHVETFFEQERDTRRIAREGGRQCARLPGMKRQKGGHIINVSSVYGHIENHGSSMDHRRFLVAGVGVGFGVIAGCLMATATSIAQGWRTTARRDENLTPP